MPLLGKFVINAVGAKRRQHYLSGEQIDLTSDSPDSVHSEYFEWESVAKAIRAFPGGRDFVIAELGAGFGRWSVNAVCMLRTAKPDARYKVIAAEADPTHFKWLKQHLSDNNIPLERCDLFDRPVTGREETVHFLCGEPSTWYGQAVVDEAYAKANSRPFRWLGRTSRVLRSVTLEEVLRPVETVDLLDLDIQGSELGVFQTSMPLINSKVLRVHISTHSPEIEQVILPLLDGWKIEHYYPLLGERQTSIGALRFVDGLIAASRSGR